mmetsp:Transcript_1043/g.2239  ORF Transcript_1043/g.2239 Transcript_1043/m.2239 type:complete len:256 (-) Transcript_1043:219-986(-)
MRAEVDFRRCSRRSSRPWLLFLMCPERDTRTTQLAPAAMKASAVTRPSPPRPPVMRTVPPAIDCAGALGCSSPVVKGPMLVGNIFFSSTPDELSRSSFASMLETSTSIVAMIPGKSTKADTSKTSTMKNCRTRGSSILADRTSPFTASVPRKLPSQVASTMKMIFKVFVSPRSDHDRRDCKSFRTCKLHPCELCSQHEGKMGTTKDLVVSDLAPRTDSMLSPPLLLLRLMCSPRIIKGRGSEPHSGSSRSATDLS